VDAQTVPDPKNIYGWSKLAAEGLCKLHSRRFGVITLRACRFFPEEDDRESIPGAAAVQDEDNLKLLDMLIGRRLTLRDVVSAHIAGWRQARRRVGYEVLLLGNHLPASLTADPLPVAAAAVVTKMVESYPGLVAVLAQRGWQLFTQLPDRLYVATATFAALQWQPVDTPAAVLEQLRQDPVHPLRW
jgi:UDP-glucose 4-epimerase